MKHAVVFCVEKGLLEEQAMLLVDSFCKFSNNDEVQLFAFSPRIQFQPSQKTIDFLTKHQVSHITACLNTEFLNYPIANKVLACSYLESKMSDFESILFLDTDTVFLNSFNFDAFDHKGVYLKPVGHKGPGTTGMNDVNDAYWTEVFSLFNLPLPPAKFRTSIKGIEIRGYFNAGLIWSQGLPGFFQQWAKDFFKLIDSGLTPYGFISKDRDNFRCLDQVALAVTVSRYDASTYVLPTGYNFHIPFKPMMIESNQCEFEDLVLIHYHKWFQHPDFLDHITSDHDKQSVQYRWLKKHLPINPLISDSFKC
jgi:hypothetical protein